MMGILSAPRKAGFECRQTHVDPLAWHLSVPSADGVAEPFGRVPPHVAAPVRQAGTRPAAAGFQHPRLHDVQANGKPM